MSIVDNVKAAGVIGAGGAGFPTHVKLNAKAEYVLLNGAECEPLLRVDQQLMAIYPKEVIEGLRLAGEQVGADKAIIGIKVKHHEAIKILRNTIKEMGLDNYMSVHELPDIYPAGDEQVLVYECTKRVVPEMGIPLNVGCVVVNTETAINIYNAQSGRPVTEKYVTIAGDVPRPITVKVPVGSPIRDLLKLAGREDLTGYKVIDGGPMMGPLLFNLDGYVTKKTKGLLVFKEDHGLIARKQKKMKGASLLNKTACEQCRICTDLCPRYLLGHGTSPHKMVRAMGFNIEADEQVTVAQTCCQCNLCEYFSCPAGINPKMANVYYMMELRNKGIKHQPTKEVFTPRSMRNYRLVPSKRLMGKLDILDYDAPAPLNESIEYSPKMVGITLSGHVGAPATAVVKPGDTVSVGQVIGELPEGGLSARVHSSVNGVVESIDAGVVKIRRN